MLRFGWFFVALTFIWLGGRFWEVIIICICFDAMYLTLKRV